MHRDMQLKKKHLLGEKMEELIRTRSGSDRDYILEQIDETDLLQPLFRDELVRQGAAFDVDRFNKTAEKARADIKILYDLAEESGKRLRRNADEQKNIVESILQAKKDSSIKECANLDHGIYGRTVFLKSRRDLPQDAGSVFLGKAGIRPGAIVSFVGTSQSGTVLKLRRNGETFSLHPKTPFKMPGVIQAEEVPCDVREIIRTPVALLYDRDQERLKQEKRYHILAGPASWIHEKPEDSAVAEIFFDFETEFLDQGTLFLYIYKGSFADFRFERQPQIKNFKEKTVAIDTPIKKIAIKLDKENRVGVRTDGSIFGKYHRGYLENDRVFCPATPFNDFLVLVEDMEHTEDYEVILEHEQGAQPEYVAIKEMEAFVR